MNIVIEMVVLSLVFLAHATAAVKLTIGTQLGGYGERHMLAGSKQKA